MKNSIKANINSLHLSDIYSLMLFILYKIQDIPEYAVLSELCYLLDSNSMTRLLTYFAGKTITIPTETEFNILINALLLYQYVNIEGNTLTEAQLKIKCDKTSMVEKYTNLYLKIMPIINTYNIDRAKVQKNDR